MLAILMLLFNLHLITFDPTADTYGFELHIRNVLLSRLACILLCFSQVGPVAGPTDSRKLHHHHHHHHHHHYHHHRYRHRHPHRTRSHAVSPSPCSVPGCCKMCLEPLTATPIGLPCGCVFPMKVRLLLQASVYAVFPIVNELEIEIAAGTYLTQSQVVITGAISDGKDQEKTALDVNLVPLGERFDNWTAALTYERFWHKKVSLNKTLFGDYEVVYIIYPGLPTAPNYPDIGPSESPRSQDFSITESFTDTNQKMNHKTIFVIAFLAIVLMIVCCGAISVILRYRRICSSSNAVGPDFTSSTNNKRGLGALLSSDKASSTPIYVVSTMPTSCLSVKKFALAELEKATDKFSSKKVLGIGGFGCVYHGIMEDGVDVAVKLLHRDDNQYGDREFIAEVEMLSRLHHRNLVQLIGICMEGHTHCMVYELIPNGSIESHLHGVDRQKGPLDWDARLKIALGAARGLAYIHEDSNPCVIHRDFKAGNVLLEDDFTPKISDFGLAREATEGSQHISTRVMGTFGYVAPEYAMTGHLLVKSDVYSYGVVLLELLTGRKPVDMSQPPGEESLVTWARPLLTTQEGLRHLVDPTLAGTYDVNDMAKVAAIASMCVHLEVTQRPFMGEVVQALKVIYYKDETTTQGDSSAVESESKGDGSWWNADGEASQRLIYVNDSSHLITMEYSSSFNAVARESVIDGLANGSGPLRTGQRRSELYKVKRSMSELVGARRTSKTFWSKGSF